MGMGAGIGYRQKGFLGFHQRLLPGYADIVEQMRVVGEVAERPALKFNLARYRWNYFRRRRDP
jgi:hypothetical protein